jgi:hypothetical protein
MAIFSTILIKTDKITKITLLALPHQEGGVRSEKFYKSGRKIH